MNYPSLLNRIKATVADSFVMVLLIVLFTYIFTLFGDIPDNVKMIVVLFIFVFYDPILISLLGGTIGHMIFGLRVRSVKNPQKKIIFPIALLRFILKGLLGWISLLTITGDEKKRAIHDMAANSVVVFYTKEEEYA
ncbi:MAG: RDD family protein [Thalassobius sp.]|nr:RDD family protein [Thalassovita sp.]